MSSDQPLDRDALMAEAIASTGLDDFGDPPFHEPLDVLVEALEREADLDDVRRAATRSSLVASLTKRLRLVDDRARFPAIADEDVTAPVFIVGLPRSGSTHLHALLDQVEGVRTPRFWEASLPSPPPEASTAETDPRIAQIQAVVDAIPSEMLVRHPLHPLRPEQCNVFLDWAFYNQALLAYHDIPTYKDWLFGADYAPNYVAHRRTLQHLQWRRPGRWVCKYPKHLLSLDALLDEYPDAVLVWTHRDPAKVLPSVASFTGLLRSQTPTYDPVRFGREWAMLEELVLRRGLDTRDRRPRSGRDIDVHYRDLMADAHGTIAAICAHAGIDYGDTSRARVQQWLDDHPQTAHGVHRYAPEDFGFTAAGLHRRFGFYLDRFDIEREVAT